MKNLNLHGGLIEMIESLAEVDVTASPIAGEKLDRIAHALGEWLKGPTYKADCRLSGIDPEQTKLVIAEIASCAQSKVPVAF